MNVRNLSFVIVLFLVWIMGYYYYSPERLAMRSGEEHTNDIQIPEQRPIEEQIVQEYAPATDQTEEPRRALEPETLPQAMPPVPVKKIEPQPVSKEIKKKKRIRKDKKKREAAQAKESFIPQQQHTSHHEESYSSSPSNDQTIKDPINITADLKKKNIGYYKMLSWHYPHLFNLTVNDQPLFTKNDKIITQAEPVAISKDEPFVIRYNYEWHTPWGKRIGAKKVTFKAQENAPQLTVHFKSNWKDEERIIVDGAEKISAELLEEEKPAV